MMQVTICNIGYRPLILTNFVAIGDKSSFSMGVDDEPAATFGVEDKRFPALLEPGTSLKIHPLTIGALEQNWIKPESNLVFYDPFKFFVLTDSFGRLHPISVEEARWHLGLDTMRVHTKWWQRPKRWLQKTIFLTRAKKRLRLDRM